ncbi:biotin carboxylase [Salinibacter ruber]|nr:ATP-grasp domain-containing protein [Salinibacter ruber]MCS3634884.1 biotin carboxylase [Salinibacter ruber]MCS3714641.1 biotin carboxylase [Salinibacter ruber]
MTELGTHDSAGRSILAINLGWEQERLLRRLGERGLNVWGVHYEDDYEPYVEYEDVLVSDIRDLNAILDYATEVDPDAVISNQDDYAQFAQALVAQELNLPGPRVAEAQVAGNKFLQRSRCQKLGIPIPDFSLCTSEGDVLDFVASQGYPIILKPVDNRGSIGVERVDKRDDVEPAFCQALTASHSRLVLAEEYVEGTQIVIDGYARPGVGCISLALGSKRMIEETSTVARDIVYPGDISDSLYREAIDLNESINEALGIRFGPTHSEYMITEDGEIILVETANRGGGVHISEIVTPAVSDFDLVGNYIDDALGNETSEFSSPEGNEVWMRFLTFSSGTVSSIGGVEKVHEEPDVLHVQMMFEKGDTIGTVSNDVDRHGYIIVETNDEGRLDELSEKIQVNYK